MMRIIDRPKATVALLLAASALLAGCGTGQEHADLREFMAEVKARPAGPVEPLPSFEQVPPFAYQASDMRSPFDPPVVLKRVERAEGGPQVTPDLNRVKQFLEQYPIASLAMVGTLAQGQRLYALVRDGEGGVHRVSRGDYMGTDHGRVQRIDDNELELIEIVPDGTGGWVERARTVTLGGTNRG
jgi:type IV pilus assembly protein PilP